MSPVGKETLATHQELIDEVRKAWSAKMILYIANRPEEDATRLFVGPEHNSLPIDCPAANFTLSSRPDTPDPVTKHGDQACIGAERTAWRFILAAFRSDFVASNTTQLPPESAPAALEPGSLPNTIEQPHTRPISQHRLEMQSERTTARCVG